MHRFIWATAIIVLGTSGHVMGQGSGSSRIAPPRSSTPSSRTDRSVPATPRPPTTTEFAASFWKDLHKPNATSRRWGSSGKTSLRESDAPHGTVGQTFLNDLANRNLKQLPTGSVLVREEYAADGRTLRNISVMYRAKAADPKNGNWYWMLYQPDGKLARTPAKEGNREIAGRVARCIECHRQAAGNDFVFLNDRPPSGAPAAPGTPVPAAATPPGR